MSDALIDLVVDDLRAKADVTDDPGCVIWLALHASAALTGDLGPFDRREVRCTCPPRATMQAGESPPDVTPADPLGDNPEVGG